MENRRQTRFYDQRLVRVVQQTRDLSIATQAGVPRSTAAGWLKQRPRAVAVATDDRAFLELHRRLAKLERRCEPLQAVLRLLLVLFRVLKPDMSHVRFVGLSPTPPSRRPDLPGPPRTAPIPPACRVLVRKVP